MYLAMCHLNQYFCSSSRSNNNTLQCSFTCCYLHILLDLVKIIATKWQILRLKWTSFNFGWSSVPDPAGGSYSTPPDLQVVFK